MKKTVAVLLAVILVMTVSVLASSGAVQATVNYRDIKITLNGQQITPKDAAGNAVEPFIMDGTTYLPVRAVADALGLSVEWDDASNTVVLKDANSAQAPASTSVQGASASSASTSMIHGRSLDTIVYVSDSSHTIHSVHNCSGMKHYSEMSIAEADAMGYKYCQKCW